jgi:hypothetical protein
MAIWALLNNKGEVAIGEAAPWTCNQLVGEYDALEKYQDALSYAKGKQLRLVQLVPKLEQ